MTQTDTDGAVRTPAIQCRIVEPEAGVFSRSSPEHYVWFEVFEPGDSYLRRVRISRRHADSELQDQLYSLDEGDIVTAVLSSESENGPWDVESLEVNSRA